jgi:chemotaxis protein MotB
MAGGVRIIKKKGGGHGHHGGAWKVAYADFVTAMMALFMVMWLLASSDSAQRQEIANYFRSGILPEGSMTMKAAQNRPSVIEETAVPPGQSNTPSETSHQMQEAISKVTKVNPMLRDFATQVSVKDTPQGVLIEIADKDTNGEMFFDVSSAKMKPKLEEFLTQLAPFLEQQGKKIELLGHTDARPFADGSGKTNWSLSFERADAARLVFVKKGLGPKINAVRAYGDSDLRDKGNPYSAANRRLQILLLNDQ